MIHYCITIVLATLLSFNNPAASEIRRVANFSPPEEINDLAHHHHQQRSIGSKPPSSNNIEETIKEVEAMLKANPDLPRLTRGEILDLVENITKTDKLAINSVYQSSTTPKPRDAKAFMVVMPYTPDNMNGKGIEELYTKPPVTHIVGAQTFKDNDVGTATELQQVQSNRFDEGSKIVKPTNAKIKKYQGYSYRRTTQSPVVTSSTEIPIEPISSLIQNNHRRRKPQPIEQQKSTTLPPLITTYSTRGRRPSRRRPGIKTTEKHPNHKYPEESSDDSVKSPSSLPSDGLRIISAPKLSPHAINDDLLMVEDQNKAFLLEKEVPFSIERVTIKHIDLDDGNGGSSQNLMKVDVPEHLKGVVADMDLESAINREHQKRVTTAKPFNAEDEEIKIKNMLASLGVLPSQMSTTTTQLPDISNVADNLSPDMKELLKSFGLLPNAQQKPVGSSQVSDSFNPVKAEIKPESYIGFKPLPEHSESRDEMEELLARFGLGRSTRDQKALHENTKKDESFPNETDNDTAFSQDKLNLEVVPEEYQGVLEDIGLSDRKGKMIRTAPLVKTQEKQHVFNPTDNKYATQEELDKLNNLMTIIKQLENLNRTVTDEDLNEIDKENLKKLVESFSQNKHVVPLNEQNAPDPLKYDYGLSKNEVKRQEDTTSTNEPSTSEETVTPNIKDLEDSFGGMSDTITEVSVPETTTPVRKTGFYYLVDWNTFLDIDDQKGKRVNLRFQPTIGDPKRFYSVSVP
nr:uncharacterized protein LOC111503165 [Leptinotarsa decemlineata]